MTLGAQIQLHDGAGSPVASVSGVTVVWFDTPDPGDWRKVTGNNGSVSTDASGWLKLDLSDVSGLSIDDWGFLVAYRLDGSDYRDSPVFAGRVQVSDVSGGTVIGPLTSWVRPANWLALPAVTVGSEKFAGLHAVYEAGSNFVALSATGAYTVNWGDGSGNINVASGVTAERNIAWADADPASDVGIADAAACTFTDSGDKVNRTAHGLLDGQIVAFSSITSTTGISTYTSYYVVGRTANTFQLSDTIGGSAKALTTDGSGQMYLPKYRQVVVTVVPNGSTITALNLHVKHSQSKLQQYSSQFLDMSIAFAALTDLRIGSSTFPGTSTQTIRHPCLQQCALVDCGVTNFSYMFNGCAALQSIPLLNTAAGTNFSYMFNGCTALQSAPVMNTAAGTIFSFMFNGCTALQSIPLLSTAAGTNFSSMFSGCAALQSIPLLSTAAGTNFSSMFSGCAALQSIPLLNTAAGTSFANMFSGCAALQSIPLLSTAAGTNFNYMFYGCPSLQSAALAGTAQNISYSGCKLSGPELNLIYGQLASGVSSKTITVTNNWGTATHTPSIATAKGWTVTA